MKKIFLIFLGILFANFSRSQEFINQDSTDLNTDGVIDPIKLNRIQGSENQFQLTVGKATVEDEIGESGPDGFQVIDIDRNDNFREIAVHTPGPSSDDEYLIYWFDGSQILKMAHLSRWPTFLGNGIVYVDNWEGFWQRRDKYVLDNINRVLTLVPQFAYYVGVKIKVENSFCIYQDKELSKKVALLSKNSEIELLLCDMVGKEYFDYIYLIKSKSNLIGWAKFQEIYNNSSGFQTAD